MSGEMVGLGDYVRRRRIEAGVTQEQLGEAVGRDQPWVSEFERGRNATLPTPDMLRAMAVILYCEVDDFLRAAGYLPPIQPDERRFAQGDLRLRLHELAREVRNVQRRVDQVVGLMDEAATYDVTIEQPKQE